MALLLFASIIAFPLSYYLIDMWLQDFAYRANIDLGIYILSYALALFIVVITVSIRAFRAISANPVESLRYE
jgi:putative ABC transport system permease protein